MRMLSYLVILIISISCSNYDDIVQSETVKEEEINHSRIYNDLIKKVIKTRANSLNTNLGYGYDFTDPGPLSSSYSKAIRESIIDVDYLYAKDKNHVNTTVNRLEQEPHFYSFHSFDEFIDQHYQNKIVTIKSSVKSSGLAKWLVKANAKYENESKSIFSNSTTSSKNIYYASGDISIKTQTHSLNLDPISRSLGEHLNTRLFIDIYFLSAEEILEKYGQFAISRYTSGAKAYSLVYSEVNSDVVEIKASESIRQYGKLSMGIAFGNLKGNGDVAYFKSDSIYRNYTKTFSELNLALKTIGGSPTAGIPASFKIYTGESVPDIEIDFTPWAATIQKTNEVIIELGNNGLIPIAEIIREKNIANLLRERIGLISQLNKPNINPMKQPVRFYYTQDLNEDGWQFIFSNRFGDNFIFAKSKSIDEFPESPNWINWDPFSSMNYTRATPIIDANNVIDLSSMQNVRFCKIKDSKYPDMTYILLSKGANRIALSLFDEFILNYNLNINSIEKIDIQDLNNYDIYAL